MFDPIPSPILAPGMLLARGVCRFLIDEGIAPVTEFSPAAGLRTDVTALARNGEIWVIECKSSIADFQSDRKWQGYLDWCDRFFFAVDGDFPDEVLPPDHGLIRADGFGAEVAREAPSHPLAAARRKAQVLRIGRAAALRLRGQVDPGLAAMLRPTQPLIRGEDELR
ncbi:MAG: MmcB family DNA repair protein [Pseudomonadota bacterium]